MANYGEILGVYEPKTEAMYGYFDDYFNHPVMYKIKNVEGLSMYMSKLYCLLNRECRYIVTLVTEDDYPKNTKKYLKNLEWISLQTRSMTDNHDLPIHSYQPRAAGPLNKKITRTEVTDETSTYNCDDFPIKVTLLHTKQNSGYQEYGNIIIAIETFQTVFTLV
uniref:Uncharacterized protein n=1 Tax=viral metagenome TaxID=1070528 RepID=A0A6C0LYI8_9ZZZZ